MKVIYIILGFALTFVTSSGVAIWIARRRDKGKPVPGWEKAWTATVWGQPIAYSAIALATLTEANVPALPLFLLLCGAALIPAFRVSNLTMSRILRLATAFLLALVVITHIGRFGVLPMDPMATLVNVTLVVISAWIAASVEPLRRSVFRLLPPIPQTGN